ncbi:MAG: DUF4389 domain-containing protein [Myxococcota bacterium]
MTHQSEFYDSELDPDDERIELDRGATGVRILYTLVFYVLANVAQGILTVLILFQLGFALITQREPGPEIRRFANQTLSYLVRIGRYLTYNDANPPFPFSEFPAELDLTVPVSSPDHG